MTDEGEKNRDVEDFTSEILKYQVEIFNFWREMFNQMSVVKPEYTENVSKILEKHWKRVEEKIKEYYPEMVSGGAEGLQKQRELYIECMKSYSQMLQEFLVSPAFLNMMKDAMSTALTRKIEMDKIQEEFLKNLGIPTKKDIHEIYYNLYIINRKLDRLTEIAEKMEGEK